MSEQRASLEALAESAVDMGRSMAAEVWATLTARLLIEDGQFNRALDILDRQGFRVNQTFPPVRPAYHLATAQAARGAGQTLRARRSYERYLALRSSPDELARPYVAAVCREYRQLVGADADRFDQCRID